MLRSLSRDHKVVNPDFSTEVVEATSPPLLLLHYSKKCVEVSPLAWRYYLFRSRISGIRRPSDCPQTASIDRGPSGRPQHRSIQQAKMILASMMSTAATQLVSPTAPDVAFHEWCGAVGIPISSSVQLATTSRSVAGRGVFAVEPLAKGEVIAIIPSACVFNPENAAEWFPHTAECIADAKVDAGFAKRGRWIGRLWSKLLRRDMGVRDTDLWAPELTHYALAAIEQGHPWADWIVQWKRDDPMHNLFMSGASSDDEGAIAVTADKLKSIMPELSHLKLRASLSVRLGRMEEHRRIVGLDTDRDMSEMYSIVTSRAIELDDDTGLTGIIPFYDMINHSLQPNLALDYDGENFELFANQDISEGEELFLTYTKLGEEMDENSALWALVQWGIPTDCKDMVLEVQ